MSEYKRLTERDEYGNADIIGLSTEKLFGELYFDEINLLTKALNKLAFLEDKIENGTLVELPCKVGDTVYSNERIMFEPLTVKVITIHQSIKFPVSYTVIAMAKNGRGIYLSRDNFNEDWFLTKAEAEAKLKELQEHGDNN